MTGAADKTIEQVTVVDLSGEIDGQERHVAANASMNSPEDAWQPVTEPDLGEQSWIMVGPRSVVILVGR